MVYRPFLITKNFAGTQPHSINTNINFDATCTSDGVAMLGFGLLSFMRIYSAILLQSSILLVTISAVPSVSR